MTTQEFLNRLQNVKSVGENQWCANCPCCNDTKRHLYISSTDKMTLLDCKKGCDWLDVLQALGLKKQDIYVNQSKRGEQWDVLRTHEYCNSDGIRLALKTVYRKSDGSKTALWQRYVGNTLERGLNGLKMPLYHVHRLKDKNKPVFIVEGEKDVETMERLGFIATSSPNGAGSHWKSEFNSILKDFDIIILADNDDVGIKFATEIANNMLKVAKSVKLVPCKALYEPLQDKGDISDIYVKIGAERTTDLLRAIISNTDYIYSSNNSETAVKLSDDTPEWHKNMKYASNGMLMPTLQNIVEILNNDDNFKGKIEYNEFVCKLEFNRKSWSDNHDSRIKLFLEKNYNIVVSVENIKHACNIIEENHRYHPVRDYISNLKWDGISRIDTVFIDFLGAKDNEYIRKVSAITFLGAIARIFDIGCKFDTCTTLVGKQGIGKSKFIRKISINPKWFTDCITTFDGKEFYEAIQGIWIVEVGEGTAFQKSTKEKVKQMITVQYDKYRTPYSRNTETYPRQCVFIGTTNNSDFLKDETGDRRFYPIDCNLANAQKDIDKDLSEEYVNQLWAEALYRYQSNEKYYITEKNILDIAEKEQRSHYDESPMQSDIMNFLDIAIPKKWSSISLEERRKYIRSVQNDDKIELKRLGYEGAYKRDRVSVKEIMCELYGYDLNQPIERKMSLDVGRSLLALGWNKSSKTEWVIPYGKIRIYHKF